MTDISNSNCETVMRRVAILISGRGSNMTALIEAAAADGFPAEIALVISNKADAPGLATAQANGVKTLVIESKPFGKDRAGFEKLLQAALDEHKIELICLGGFMRLFTAEFVQHWYGRMLNIHPSLLPSFPGLDPHGQALRAGVKISGATVHFVIPETDAGPIVMQGAVPVATEDTPETLAARVLGVEHQIYPQALRLLATGGIKIDGDVTKSTACVGSDDTLIAPTVI
ncbi:phosphoribosylglycinamide formyltransferase-1 [Bradyrhizobium sp. NFR13]|jgi:phosphoribosylglycinamide formyltransferase-1|nr:phosphoribosylglycinamide formyltransferase-1 [Bradyrhizobium sp. NFR13]